MPWSLKWKLHSVKVNRFIRYVSILCLQLKNVSFFHIESLENQLRDAILPSLVWQAFFLEALRGHSIFLPISRDGLVVIQISGLSLERVQRVQLHPSIFSYGKLHTSISNNPKLKVKKLLKKCTFKPLWGLSFIQNCFKIQKKEQIYWKEEHPGEKLEYCIRQLKSIAAALNVYVVYAYKINTLFLFTLFVY